MHGEVISPMLFSLYVNDFEINFLTKSECCYELQELSFFLFMYADDLVLFSKSQSGLQSMLNILHKYTLEWNLEVNINKTKIIVFRNCGHAKDSEKWLYCDNEIEIVDQFNYFGFLLNYNAKFHVNQQHFALQGRKAMYAIKSRTRNLFFKYRNNVVVI